MRAMPRCPPDGFGLKATSVARVLEGSTPANQMSPMRSASAAADGAEARSNGPLVAQALWLRCQQAECWAQGRLSTQVAFCAHLREVMTGRTAVLISHRVAAVKDADQVLVLDGGRVVERGRHADLLAAGGVYADLDRNQLDLDAVAAVAPAAPGPRGGAS